MLFRSPPFEAGAVQVSDIVCSPGVAVRSVGVPGIVCGVTDPDDAESGPAPPAVAAATVNVYAVPLVSPVTTQLRAPFVLHVYPPGVEVATYPVMTRPPRSAGALQLTVTCWSSGTASTLVGISALVGPDWLIEIEALAVVGDAFMISRRDKIVGLAAQRRLPAIYPAREFADNGGLMSYGTRWADMYVIVGTYAGRLLKGAKPADLPVQRPNRYELVINLRTAKALGLTPPPVLLGRADEVLD